MYKKEKALIFVFHVSFLIIIVGAAITRYAGFEGSMSIREGASQNQMISFDTYITIKSGDQTFNEPILLSKISKNSFDKEFTIGEKSIDVKLLEYIPDAAYEIVEDINGKPIINMMITNGNGANKVQLEYGESVDAGEFVIDFNSSKSFEKPVLALFVKDEKLFMSSPFELNYMKMGTQLTGKLDPSSENEFETKTLYTIHNSTSFVMRDFIPKATKKLVSAEPIKGSGSVDALKFLISSNDKKEEIIVFGTNGMISESYRVHIDGVDMQIGYGSKIITLPFYLKLVDFQIERYPGSMSPSSYASEVVLIDEEADVEMPFRIFMNHILDYKGYRFFQSSYDMDEKGTILSVNNDPGTLITYIGYFLLGVGMFGTLIFSNGRFKYLSQIAKKMSDQKNIASLLVAFFVAFATPSYSEEINPVLKTVLSFDKEHAQKFGSIVVQDSSGRMKPLDTLTQEILNKLHGKNEILGLDANQVVLGMMIRPDAWRDIKMIYIANDELRAILGMEDGMKYAAFSEFFNLPEEMKEYKLTEQVNEASRKPQSKLTKFDKAVLSADEKLNITYMVFSGSLIRIWPMLNDENNKWLSTIEALQTSSDSEKIRNLAIDYFTSIDDALLSGDWSKSYEKLNAIVEYQKTNGSAVYLSDNKVNFEILYNKINIFESLWPLYFLVGFVLLILSFVKILKPAFKLDFYSKSALYLLILFFVAHTFGLGLRWYISGHAPWSDGYESMIYIAWATVLAGFIFAKNSPITLASTSILSGLVLFVAHLNWMNPQVTNLVPVLQSYWLSIHVSMITASYGFLGLGALLGFITLILFAIKSDENKNIALSIKELNAINEMSLMIGLAMLTVGNFLGGVWANESWGRYWGWDPKETWALVTILVYAVVIHLRFIKPLSSQFAFSVASLLAFSSVLMTYFGVNYYLAGLHSYAKGDPIPVPDFVPITYLIIFGIIALAYRKRELA
jgi:cytochrome c-type biogenesis protein CcsB